MTLGIRYCAGLWAISVALGQTPDSAAIRGRIADISGAAIPGASVEVVNEGTSARRTTIADAEGRYAIPLLSLAGSYTMRFAHAGMATEERRFAGLRAGETAIIDAVLAPEHRRTEVTVTATAAPLRSDLPELGTPLNHTAVSMLPVLGRKLTNLALLDSSIRSARGTGDLFLNNTLFVANASGRRQTTYVIDGSTGDDAWGRQTVFANVPLAAVHEVAILPNAFSPEYGRTAGSAVNINTISGANRPHGELLFVRRPGELQARPPSGAPGTSDRLTQVSGAVSGALRKDSSHFAVSGEYNRQTRDSTITSSLAAGVYVGEYTQKLGFARLDHRFNDTHTAALRLFADQFEDTNPQDVVGGITLPSAGRHFGRGAYSAQASDTAVMSPSLLNVVRAQFQLGSPITRFTPVVPSTQYIRAGVSTEGESRTADLQSRQWQIADTISAVRGAHNLRVGADAMYSRSGGSGQEFGGGYVLGQFTLTPAGAFQRYTQSFGNDTYGQRQWLAAVFVQDAWRVMRSLAVDVGVRYDHQSFTDDRKMVSPRAGFSWSPGGSTRTVMRGAYGLFYSQLRANLAAVWSINGPEGIFTFSAAPGQAGFPADGRPLAAWPVGAVLPARDIAVRPGQIAYLSRFLDVSRLPRYPDALVNPRTQQATVGIERELFSGWTLLLDYLHQHTTRIDRQIDINAPAAFIRTQPGQVRTAAEADATRPIRPGPGGFRRIASFVNDGMSRYDALRVNLRNRMTRRAAVLVSYTYSNAINTLEPDTPASLQDPNDANLLGRSERAQSVLNQRHRAVIAGWWRLPGRIDAGGTASLASGRPYNITTGLDNNGDGSTSDRPVVDGSVIGRNLGRGSPIYDVAVFGGREFAMGETVRLEFRGEAFNVMNHANIVGRNAVWGNGAAPLSSFGQAIGGMANVESGRMFQFLARLRF